jgi:hypothetical protein
MVGYDREDLVSSGIRWMELAPPEWGGLTSLSAK